MTFDGPLIRRSRPNSLLCYRQAVQEWLLPMTMRGAQKSDLRFFNKSDLGT